MLGEKVKVLRLAKGMSQPALAAKAGLSWGAIRMIEGGHLGLRSKTITKLAQALEVDPSEIINECRTTDSMMSLQSKNFKNIMVRMVQKNMTPEDLSIKSRLPIKIVMSYISGQVIRPKYKILQAIAAALDTKVPEIYDGSSDLMEKEDDNLVTKALVLVRDGFKCRSCSRSFQEVDLEIDLLTPKSDGGTNHIDNLQVLCVQCYREKTISDEQVRSTHEAAT